VALDPNSRARFNFDQAAVLLVDSNQLGLDILAQVMTGLGAWNLHRCGSAEEAREVCERLELDLVITDAMSPSGEGYEFVEWLRRMPEPNCFVPVLLTAGHTPAAEVARARDCGAHFILKKPLTPIAMLERILWISKEGRPFVTCDAYVGPERRFKNIGPPGAVGRRKSDQNAEVGLATDRNMTQDELDGLLRPNKVVL
jgi:CheY-like chemotaxis protein